MNQAEGREQLKYTETPIYSQNVATGLYSHYVVHFSGYLYNINITIPQSRNGNQLKKKLKFAQDQVTKK